MGLASAGRLAGLVAAALLAVPAGASAATLHDQLDNQATEDNTSTPSYFYETGDMEDEQAADDFTVPAGQAWTIDGAQAPGLSAPGTLDFQVTLFNDAAGKPGSPVAQTRSTIPASGALFTFPVGPTTLQPGRYWISIQVMNLVTWSWKNRTVLDGSPAMWQQVGAPLCPAWTPRTECIAGTSAFPDQAFSVLGSSAPLPVTAPKKKCKKHKKKHKRSAESAKKKKCKKKKKRR